MATPPRWFTDNEEGHSQWYVDHFRELAEAGEDLAGEARMIDAMVPRQARILDAGCGQGRTGAALFSRGHHVVGIDADPVLLTAAIEDYQGPTWRIQDLAELTLEALQETKLFDAAVLAGNVMAFVAKGSEVQVLSNIRRVLKVDGFAVVGFHTDRYDVTEFDSHVAQAGFTLESRFATWDLRPWNDDAEFAVTVLRNSTF
jgi:SAM-dependent methyltransferase